MALRLDTVNAMDPGAPDPIGTLREIKKLGLNPMKYATCSLPSRRNRGCEHYEHPVYGPCPIRALLARRGKPGPEMVAFAHVKSPTVWKQDATQCFNYQSQIAHNHPALGVSRIIGIGGDVTIKRRETVPVPGVLNKGKMQLVPQKIEPFPRPADAYAGQMSTVDMAQEMLQQSQNEDLARLAGLGQGSPPDADANVGDDSDAVLDDDEVGDEDIGLDDDEPAIDDDAMLEDEPPALRQVSKGRRRKKDDDGD